MIHLYIFLILVFLTQFIIQNHSAIHISPSPSTIITFAFLISHQPWSRIPGNRSQTDVKTQLRPRNGSEPTALRWRSHSENRPE